MIYLAFYFILFCFLFYIKRNLKYSYLVLKKQDEIRGFIL